MTLDLPMKMGAISLGIVLCLETAGYVIREVVYTKAEAVAIQKYGDRKAPLSEEEKDEWFSDMGVEKGRKPTIPKLRRFVEENKQE